MQYNMMSRMSCLAIVQVWSEEGEYVSNTFLLNKKKNTLLGRSFIYVAKGDISNADRLRMKNNSNQIKVDGCKELFRFCGASPPRTLIAWELSCR